jgi:hypothetical protein
VFLALMLAVSYPLIQRKPYQPSLSFAKPGSNAFLSPATKKMIQSFNPFVNEGVLADSDHGLTFPFALHSGGSL